MTYADDEVKDLFAKSENHLLKVICSRLEFESSFFHYQLSMVEVEDDFALMAIDSDDIDRVNRICEKVNSAFPRTDKKSSCQLYDMENMIITCVATGKNDLRYLL